MRYSLLFLLLILLYIPQIFGTARIAPVRRTKKNTHALTTFYCRSMGIVCYYQMISLLEGAMYILSFLVTPKVSYHSSKFLGGMLPRR